MAEQNRQYEDDYRNGRRFEPSRGQESWRRTRDDDRDDRYGYGADRERWMGEREGSYGRGGTDRHDYEGQDRYDFSGGGRQGRSWRDEPRDVASRGSSGFGESRLERERDDWGGRYGRGEGGFSQGSSSESYAGGRMGSTYGSPGNDRGRGFYGSQGNYGGQGAYGTEGRYSGPHSMGSQGYSGAQGYERHGWGPGQSYGEERFGRGGESYGRSGEHGRSSEWSGGVGQRGHTGKGPKNYKRSDDRIQEELCDRLTDDAMIDASEINVQVKNGEVTLSGTVNSRDEKRHAEDIAERSSGVREVINNLRVQRQEQQGDNRDAATRQQAGTGSSPSPTAGQQQGSTSGSTKGGRQTGSGD